MGLVSDGKAARLCVVGAEVAGSKPSLGLKSASEDDAASAVDRLGRGGTGDALKRSFRSCSMRDCREGLALLVWMGSVSMGACGAIFQSDEGRWVGRNDIWDGSEPDAARRWPMAPMSLFVRRVSCKSLGHVSSHGQ